MFLNLKLSKDQLQLVGNPLAGFTGGTTKTEGSITLPVELGKSRAIQRMTMEFVIAKLAYAHNIILGKSSLGYLGYLISIEHLCMKFQTP